jgi:hypothetical protein
MSDRDSEILGRVRAARRALQAGDVDVAYRVVASIEHALAYGLDTLPMLELEPFVESAAALPTTGVQTAEKALARVILAGRSGEPGPTRFTLIVEGEIEGDVTAELYSSAANDGERARLAVWIERHPHLAAAIATLARAGR